MRTIRVGMWPLEVTVGIRSAKDVWFRVRGSVTGYLHSYCNITPRQARRIAAALLKAADEAEGRP